jgi:hypothetical protein
MKRLAIKVYYDPKAGDMYSWECSKSFENESCLTITEVLGTVSEICLAEKNEVLTKGHMYREE